ncbi:protein crumbs homolog 3b [Cyprinodon tularosa]|uniref:protein crumbs homolog 3b n=1 Tax=Cyprinodon tularosa TaxID=77115 RepID=UPI0018E2790E|nr:protein crumbs homolog 3b [Cyprinodon tularosa]
MILLGVSSEHLPASRCAAKSSHPLMLFLSRCKTEGSTGLINSPLRCYTRQEWFPPAMSASVFSLFSLLTLSLLLLLCVIRKKRRMEGKYRPSAEEKKQSRATVPERPSLPLPLPKEERLI